jgi:type IV secretory pathway TrbF-like protein
MKKYGLLVLAISFFGTVSANAAPSAPTAVPTPNDEQLGGNCANHLAKFDVVQTDCSIQLKGEDHTYCFASESDQEEFKKDLETNMSKARAFYEQVVKPGKYVPIPPEALTPRTPPRFSSTPRPQS